MFLVILGLRIKRHQQFFQLLNASRRCGKIFTGRILFSQPVEFRLIGRYDPTQLLRLDKKVASLLTLELRQCRVHDTIGNDKSDRIFCRCFFLRRLHIAYFFQNGLVIDPVFPRFPNRNQPGQLPQTKGTILGEIKFGRFLVKENIDADFPFGLIAVAGKPPHMIDLVDGHHIVVVGRIERHGQLFGIGILIGIDIVFRYKNIVTAQCAVFFI